MLMPSIFGENLFDDFFEDFPWMDDNMDMKKTEKKLYGRRAARLMKTDIKEQDNERYSGACSRSFYVGDAITEEDIKGEFKHGILKLFVPKKEAKPAVEDHKYIAIEG